MKPERQRYEFTVSPQGRDTYPNDFKCWVIVKDNKLGTVFKRRGYGKFIGNFSPIWISLDGKTKQLIEWERELYTYFENG